MILYSIYIDRFVVGSMLQDQRWVYTDILHLRYAPASGFCVVLPRSVMCELSQNKGNNRLQQQLHPDGDREREGGREGGREGERGRERGRERERLVTHILAYIQVCQASIVRVFFAT